MSSKRSFGDMTGVTCTRQEHESHLMFFSGKACRNGAGRFGRGCQAFTINAMNAAIDVKHLISVWEQFRAATDITPIRDEAHYGSMTEMLQALLDETQGEETHPAMGLVDIVGDLIEDYEAKQHPLPEVTGVQALKFLMEQHGLKQSDLSEIGSQGVVSEILTGKRELNIRQVRALSERFGVSAATFV
jgi:HTH-type transcriptional regulator/antitoxin HigA